jgi:predicted DNA-binding transcriptional regulator AlpA
MANLNISDRERARRARQREDSLAQRRAMTLEEWCAARRISRGMFYKLRRQGRAPRTYTVGTRRFVSNEADQAWQAEQESQNSAA